METRPPKQRKISFPATITDSTAPSGTRTVRSAAEDVAVSAGKLVECTNTLSLSDFCKVHYHQGTPISLASKLAKNELEATLTTIEKDPDLLEPCFKLVESTSRHDYAVSEIKWSAAKKRREMQLPDLKYLVLKSLKCDGAEEVVGGFISFMVTYEDGREVLYVYEVHLQPKYRGKGLGRALMEAAEGVSNSIGLEKVMLTVFRKNEGAVGMYAKLGYTVDEYSPEPKRLRNGTLKESGYVILSKNLKKQVKDKHKENYT